MQPYFTRFPLTVHSNTECVDITRRTKVLARDRKSPYTFYPYTLNNGLRSDQVSEYYYDDSELDWLVYIANGVIDPYYDWYLDEENFASLIVEKYGSIELALKKVKFYRLNWSDDDNEITPAQYNGTIPFDWKKYYTPVLAPNFKVVSYKRRQQDTTMNTNRILEYTIGLESNTEFTIGEIVDIKEIGFDTTTGTGEVVYTNTSIVRIQSVSGNTTANTSYNRTIVGETSTANATANAVFTVYENIPESEEVFWSPVYLYEYEREFNEQRKHIVLVGDNISGIVVNEITKKLRSDG